MATLLDVGILEHFAPIFTFLFVFIIIYAISSKTEPFGDNHGIYALIAIILAALTLFFPPVVGLINIMAPWFVLLITFLFFIFLVVMAFGVEFETITDTMKNKTIIFWVILAMVIAIGIYSFSQVYGPELAGIESGDGESINEENGEGFNATVKDILFHPKVLGVVFLLVLSAIAVKTLSSPAE